VEEIMIRRILSTLSALILILAIVSTAVASNGTQIGTVGAKSTAMGSAFRGLSDDWSAAYFNPAGITQFGKWNIGASAGFIMPRGSYTAHPYPQYPTAGLKSGEVNATDRNFLVPALGIFYKPTDKLSIGLGVFAPFGLGTEWDFFEEPAGYGNPNAISKEKESYSDHMVIDIQPTVAYKVSDNLSIGVGLKYTWGKMTLDEVMMPQTDAIIYGKTGGQVPLATIDALLGGLQQVGAAIQKPLDPYRIIVENNLDGKGSAYGANVGILFKPWEKLSVGLSGRFSTDLKLKGSFKLTAGMPDFRAQMTTLAAMNPAVAPFAPTVNAIFNGTNQILTDIDNVEADLPLPWTIGGGIAFKPCTCWTITADASYTNWKAWDKIELKQNGVTINELPLNWKNTLEIGAGVEFMAMHMESKKLFLRLGGYTVDSPVPNSTMNPTLLDPTRRYVATGGVGVQLSPKISIDLAYEHVMFKKKDIPASDYVMSGEGYPMNYAGVYKFNANVITLATTISL
jgi:long-chain fatty acid transport protein